MATSPTTSNESRDGRCDRAMPCCSIAATAHSKTSWRKTGRDLIKPGAHRGAAVADFDNDGRLDLVVTALGERAKLLRNVATSEGRWLMLRLVGRASNRDGLGTVVRLTLDDGRVLMSHATTSVRLASSSDPRVHFGVPRNRSVQRVSLQWPSGASQTIEHPALNQILTVEEPK